MAFPRFGPCVETASASGIRALSPVPPDPDQIDAAVPLEVTRQIDAICDEFERTLKAGASPQLEQYLGRVAPPWRQSLLKELTEMVLDRLNGEGTVCAGDVVLDANPSIRDELVSIVANAHDASNGAAATVDDDSQSSSRSGGLNVRCPHCHSTIPLLVDASLMEIDCQNCGGEFSLINDAEETRDAAVLSRIAHFEIIERLGMGQFGTVWKARDTLLERTVALKIPRREQLDPLSVEKFMREARAAAQLRHPNIISTHEVGRDGDTFYIVTDYVRGVPLSSMLADHRLAVRESVTMLAKIASALDHAHRAGVIHRDLKPSNILVDDHGEPHLMDFGLAKRKEIEVSITTDGVILGTPAYMPPEQARGEANRVDGRSDVYSAGVILFQMLTGELPFRGSTRMLLQKVIADDAPGPRTLESRVPRDLDTICLKCLEKEPSRRYASADLLAADLRRFLAGQPVLARRLGPLGRTIRWARRNPAIASLLTATVLTLLVASIVSSYFGFRAAANAARADHEAQAVTDTLYDSLLQEIQLTRETRAQGYGPTIRELVARAQELPSQRVDKNELRRQLTLSMGDFVAEPPLVITPGMKTITLCLSRDGREVFAGQIADHDRGRIVIFDGQTGALRAELASFDRPIESIAVSTDDARLVAVDMGGNAHRWRRTGDKWTEDGSFRIGTGERASFCSPDAELIVSNEGSQLTVWDAVSGSKRKSVSIDSASTVENVGFDPAHRRFMASCFHDKLDEMEWRIWDLDSDDSKPAHQITFPSLGGTYANDIDVTRQGDQVAIGFDEALLIYGMQDFQRINSYGIDSTKAVAFSPSIPYLATTNIRGWITIWNSVTNRPLATLHHPRQRVSIDDLAFSGDGRRLASSNSDSIQVWNLSAADEKLILSGHRGGIPCAVFCPSGNVLATGGKDDVVRIWDPSTARLEHEVQPHEAIQSLAYSPDGSLLAVGCMGRDHAPHLRIYDSTTGQQRYEGTESFGEVYSVDWAEGPDGTLLAACGPQYVALWRVAPGDPLKLDSVFQRSGDRCLATVLEPHGKWMAWVENDATLRAWDINKNQPLRLHAPPMLQGWHGLAVMPDSESIVYVSKVGVVEIWNIVDDRRIDSIGSPGTFSAPYIALSPGGKWLAAIVEQNAISIWHLPNKEHVYSIRPELSTVWSLSWDQAGEQLAVGQSDGGLAIWRLPKIAEKLAAGGLQWNGGQ